MYKKYLFVFVLFFAFGCQNIKTRDDFKKDSPKIESHKNSENSKNDGALTTAPAVTPTPAQNTNNNEGASGGFFGSIFSNTNGTTTAPTPIPKPPEPKFGIILGPSGARSFAAIAYLHEIQKLKIPITAIVGMEFSSVPAAIFAQKQSSNDVEWQMMKLKDEEFSFGKGLIKSSSEIDSNSLVDFLTSTVGKSRVENGKIPFACPSFNIKKNQFFMMSRGPLDQLLPFCVAYPPLFKPYQGSVANLTEYKSSVDWLKSQGVSHILYINFIGQPNLSVTDKGSASQVVWGQVASQYQRLNGVDSTIVVNLESFKLEDFNKKRDIMNRASEMAQSQLRSWAKSFGY